MQFATIQQTMSGIATVILSHDRISRDVRQQIADSGFSEPLTAEQQACLTEHAVTLAELDAALEALAGISALLDANDGAHRKALARFRSGF
jgi:hypothetical protein